MRKIVLTGVSGQLGGQVARYLIEKGVAATNIRGLLRNPAKAGGTPLGELGLELVNADYDEPDSLVAAFDGASQLFFVSSPLMDDSQRLRQHTNVVEAAKQAGVAHISYTSFAGCDSVKMAQASVHPATEQLIRASGIPYTFLRNALYLEMVVNPGLQAAVASGELISTTATGKMNYVARQDLAAAAAEVLATSRESSVHHNQVYELVNPQPFSFSNLAAVISEVAGKQVVQRTLPAQEALQALVKLGLPEQMAYFVVYYIETAVEAGDWAFTSPDLTNLISNAFTPLDESVRQVLSASLVQ